MPSKPLPIQTITPISLVTRSGQSVTPLKEEELDDNVPVEPVVDDALHEHSEEVEPVPEEMDIPDNDVPFAPEEHPENQHTRSGQSETPLYPEDV